MKARNGVSVGRRGHCPQVRTLPIADVVILGKPTQQMQLADSVRADEIAAGQISVAVENPAAFPQMWNQWGSFLPVR